MALVKKTLWNDIKALILEQYKGAPNYLAMLKAIIEETLQPAENSVYDLQSVLNVYSASGSWLDLIGQLVGLTRYLGETDSIFRERILKETKRDNAGAPDYVVELSAEYTGDTQPQYLEEAPATFFIYTPKGHQLYKKQVKSMAPAGVLGLVGAGLLLGDGSVLGSSENKVILAVANDDNVEQELALMDNSGRLILTRNEEPVIVKIKGETIPTKTIDLGNGEIVKGVRIKDLPETEQTDSYMVKDSDEKGTTKVHEEDLGMHTKTENGIMKFYRGKKQEE